MLQGRIRDLKLIERRLEISEVVSSDKIKEIMDVLTTQVNSDNKFPVRYALPINKAMDHLADVKLSRFKYASVGIVGASTGQYLLFKDWKKLTTS